MRVSQRASGPVTILDVEGGLKLDDGSTELLELVRQLLQQDRKRVVVNLAAVPAVDSAGLGALVQSYATARRQGGAVKLLNPARRVRELLVITKLSTVLECFDDERTAVGSFDSNGDRAVAAP